MIHLSPARIAVVLVATVLAFPASAATRNAPTVFDKPSCARAVTDARDAAAASQVSEKVQADVAELIRVSDHLCTQGNFVYAENMLQIARGMVAEE